MKSNCILLLVIGVFTKKIFQTISMCFFEKQTDPTLKVKDDLLIGNPAQKSKKSDG